MARVAPKSSIADLEPYKPAIRKPSGEEQQVIRLSLNEGALGPSPKAALAISEAAKSLHRYPNVPTSGLAHAIAERHGIDPERIVVGCGSDELIQALCFAYLEPGEELIYTEYAFRLFPMAAKIAGGVPVMAPDDGFTASVDSILAKVTEKTKLVFLANPNNPTGTYVPTDEVRRLRASLPGNVMLVLDAAYAEYVQRNDYTAGIELVDETDNTIMLRTFSKMYGMAGLRLGWAYACQEICDVLLAVKPPFGVNNVAVLGGIATMEDAEFFERSLAHNAAWLAWTEEELKKLGLTVHPTVANFFMVTFPTEREKGAEAARDFLAGRNILVRGLGDYGVENSLRIAVGTGDEMRALRDALAEFLGISGK